MVSIVYGACARRHRALAYDRDVGSARAPLNMRPPIIYVNKQCNIITGAPAHGLRVYYNVHFALVFDRVVGLHTRGNMMAPPPSLAKDNTK